MELFKDLWARAVVIVPKVVAGSGESVLTILDLQWPLVSLSIEFEMLVC